ncbi:hypothetical protein [Microbacterium sp.]|uniref:hypothetical protein n=1 Tax=Microbacterium sp. TaxID=51671 RepID=UPI00260BC9A6|nr:hypothetical protein [Microbacterium sp.]
MNRDDVLEALRRTNAIAGLSWAFGVACEQILEDFTRGSGYGALTAGVGRYEVLANRLDRVFSCGDYAVDAGMESAGLDFLFEGLSETARTTMPLMPAGTVTRSNLNGSNGWSLEGFRFITHAFEVGERARLDWTRATPTVQAVSRQMPEAFVPSTLLDQILQAAEREDLAAQDVLPVVGMPTYVLGHALNLATFERELIIGHSRYNDDLGNPWNWTEDLEAGTDGGPVARPKPGAVPPRSDEPDVAVRLRPAAAAEDVK